MNERVFERKAAESLKSETLRYPLWPLTGYCCRRMNERVFERKAAESLKSETLRYPLIPVA
jgi:hypothetical protein